MAEGLMKAIEEHRVPCSVNAAYYVPNFISAEEEEYLLRKISETPRPKWREVSHRRLQVWGGNIDLKSDALLPEPMPSFLRDYPYLLTRLKNTGVFDRAPCVEKAPNHVILNEYPAGIGITPHEDGPSYYPVVATISLGSHTVMNYYRYRPDCSTHSDGSVHSVDACISFQDATSSGRSIDPQPVLTLLLEPRSLVVTTSELYTNHLHGIDDITSDSFQPPDAAALSGSDESNTKESNTFAIANYGLLGSSMYSSAVEGRGTLERTSRTSLTCRVVEKVMGGIGRIARPRG
ncbi:uncharacterized protein EI90DRAFT_2977629 [Cantharellus anzutake]|uniref:uncharacterized protein n=1 Tax=Cantharellus anzutake TaxID=1750568 RepID=UPI001905D07B|nr:uncharacterized protein EI90DRAFT_2977629 [Cantharellus anzutake]KAF8322762.1 hypothetical protein EI90DRAFT_2977629 [Cantharellus anzutake]